MAYGTDPGRQYSYGAVSDANHRRFRESLGLQTAEAPDGPSLTDLRSAVTTGSAPELAEMGRAVRDGLDEPLDADLLERELSALAERFDRFPDLRASGIPDDGETPYQDLTGPAWRIEEHLVDTGFFASAEDELPSFTPEHIESTTRQLLQLESLPETLSALGFEDDEQAALVTNVLNSSEQLAWWEPTVNYPSARDEGFEDGVEHEYVPPLHERATGGALLWIDGLDWYLWQNEVLLTESMVERGVWDVRTMLAGAYLLGDAARSLAAGTIDDEDLTTLITASTATMIIGQEFLVEDVVRITDETRKPRTGGETR